VLSNPFKVSNLLLVTFAIAVALGTRFYLSRVHKEKVRDLILESTHNSFIQNEVKITGLDFLRGDFLVRLERPPFQPRNWTVNTYTGQIIDWNKSPQGPEKEHKKRAP
jgi:hypothetical protein